jgi:hypothetical protein
MQNKHGMKQTGITAISLQVARSGKSVTVIASDTDVLVLLVYHYEHGLTPHRYT